MTVTCRFCQRNFAIPVTADQIDRWCAGEMIQRVMPTLSASERELLMTQTCGECFDKMFADDDTEEN